MAAKDGKAVAQVLYSKRDHSEVGALPLPNRDRKGAVEPPMAAKDGKAVAQVLDSKRDHSEVGALPLPNRDRKGAVEPPMAAKDGKAVAQVLDSKRDHSEVGVLPLPNRDRKGAVELPMAAKDGKAVAQVLDSKRDHSEVGALPLPNRDRKERWSRPWRRKTVRRSRKFLIPSATTRKSVPCRYRTATVRERWPPMAAKDGKAVAQVLDSKRDHSEVGMIVTTCSFAERNLTNSPSPNASMA